MFFSFSNRGSLCRSIVYLLDADGNPVQGWQSATGSADERVDLVAPEPGTYDVFVDVYSAADGVTWDATATSVVAGGAPLTLDPPVLAATQGVPVSYSASWADLAPNTTYLGLVNYGETGEFTVVQVATGDAPEPGAPVNTSPPTIDPGTLQLPRHCRFRRTAGLFRPRGRGVAGGRYQAGYHFR